MSFVLSLFPLPQILLCFYFSSTGKVQENEFFGYFILNCTWMIGVFCLCARENWQLFNTAYKGDKTNHLDLCQRSAENPVHYKVVLDVTKMYMKLHLSYRIACKRDTDMYMWVHVGTKTVLIAWKEKPYGKKLLLGNFFSSNWQWMVVNAFKSFVLALFIPLFLNFLLNDNLLSYYFIAIIKLSLSQPVSFLNFILLSSHQGWVSKWLRGVWMPLGVKPQHQWTEINSP